MYLVPGVYLVLGGVLSPRRVYLVLGVYLVPGGVWLWGGVCSQGVSALGGVCSREVSALGGVCIPACTEVDTPL